MVSRVVVCLVAVFALSASRAAGSEPSVPSGSQEQNASTVSQESPTAEPEFYAADPALAAYVRAALATNPGLQAGFAQYRAALERVPTVTALPEPTVTVGQALRSIETRAGPQLETATLAQMFPWFGTLDLRGQVAVKEAAVAQQAFRERQRELIALVKRAFYNLAYVDAALDVAREEQAVLQHYEELAQARYASGQGLQQAVIRIQAEITKVAKRLDVLEQQRETLAARLNTLMNEPPQQAIPPASAPMLPPEVPLDLSQLDDVGSTERPAIRAADLLIERSETAIELARKSYWPTLTLGAGFTNIGRRGDPAGLSQPPPDNGKNTVMLNFGLTLPLRRDKYRADVRRAGEELSAARLQRQNVYNEMAFDVRDQVVRLQTLREQIRLVGEVLLPQVDEALRSTEAAYETGQVGVLDLLDSERSRLDVRLVHARDTADYLVALADLERAIGAPFPTATRIP